MYSKNSQRELPKCFTCTLKNTLCTEKSSYVLNIKNTRCKSTKKKKNEGSQRKETKKPEKETKQSKENQGKIENEMKNKKTKAKENENSETRQRNK